MNNKQTNKQTNKKQQSINNRVENRPHMKILSVFIILVKSDQAH